MNASVPIRLSVLVPIYGVERFIGDCARSIFEQSLCEGVEIIFVDDASPDKSVDKLRDVMASYPTRAGQVHILHHEKNRGLAAARRTAIDASRGEWILHLDSDDVLTPNALSLLLAQATNGLDMVFGDYYSADDPAVGAPKDITHTPNFGREWILRSLVAQNHHVTNRTWGVLIRRSLCVDCDIFPIEGINFAEDYAVMPRLLHAARAIATISDLVCGYRVAREGSYMKRLDVRAASQYVAANRVVTDYLKRQPDYAELRDSVILGRLNIEKWILKRHLNPLEFDSQLFFDEDRPTPMLHRLYGRAIASRSLFFTRLLGFLANLGR